MKSYKGYYSLIQYCPDPSRAEAANIGVVLSCPERGFVRAEIASGNERIRRFFGSGTFDKHRIQMQKEAVARRLNDHPQDFLSLEALQQFAETRANQVRLTFPRPMKVCEPGVELLALFDELVGGRTRRRQAGRRQAGSRSDAPFAELERAFRSPRFEGRVFFDVAIDVPLLKRRLEIPYICKNGKDNYIIPRAFGGTEGQAVNSAEMLAVEGDLILRHLPDQRSLQIVVAPTFRTERAAEARGTIAELLRTYGLRVVDEDEVPGLVEELAPAYEHSIAP